MRVQLRSKLAKLPTRANPWDAGADLYSIDGGILEPGERGLFDTGVVLELADGYVGYVCPRSGLAHHSGISIVNSPGVVDSGYRGTIKVNLINLGHEAFLVNIGQRIAQLVVQNVIFPDFENSPSLSDTLRGDKGFGSSGK